MNDCFHRRTLPTRRSIQLSLKPYSDIIDIDRASIIAAIASGIELYKISLNPKQKALPPHDHDNVKIPNHHSLKPIASKLVHSPRIRERRYRIAARSSLHKHISF
jgi:hypothetical protein